MGGWKCLQQGLVIPGDKYRVEIGTKIFFGDIRTKESDTVCIITSQLTQRPKQQDEI